MTETANTNDQAERLRRLQERRAASGRSTRTPTAGTGSTPQRSARRRHPAAATRVFLAGLSVTSFFAVGGAIAVANRPALVVQTVAAATPGTNTGGTSSTAGTAASTSSVTNAVVHTTTGGS